MKKIISMLVCLVLVFTLVSANASFEEIKKGAKGDSVKEIQTILKDQGYLTGSVDGDFGSGTEKAVKAFQAANGLEETGIVDETTYEKLMGWDDCEHQFSDWEKVSEPTCTVDGEQMRTCTLCGKPEYEAIPATGHVFGNVGNTKVQLCTVCGLMDGETVIGEEVVSDEHSFVVKSVDYARKITIDQRSGGYTYKEGSFIAVELDFTNLSNESFDRWNSYRVTDMTLTYDFDYRYNGEYFLGEDIVALDSGKMYIMYTVPELLKDNTDKSVIAEFSIDDEHYVINVCSGTYENDVVSIEETDNDNTDSTGTENLLEEKINIGETRTDGCNFEFTLDDVYYSDKVLYRWPNGGSTELNVSGKFVIVELTISNMTTETIGGPGGTKCFSDLILTYDETYKYDGNMFFPVQIVPLASGKVMIYYTVPELLKDSNDKSIVVTFGVHGHKFNYETNEL